LKDNEKKGGMKAPTFYAVTFPPPVAKVWVKYRVSKCGICGRQSCTGEIFFRVFCFSRRWHERYDF